MSTPVPYQQPTATPAGQPTPDHDPRKAAAQDFLADLESSFTNSTVPNRVPTTTRFHDPRPVPAIGTALPVPQPGRPPMSQRAVDLNTTILSSSVLAAVLGGATSAVLWASGKADPEVIAWVCGCVVAAPAFIALPVLALKGLMKSAKEVVQATPPEIHNHFNGTVQVDRREVHTKTSGVIATTRNQLPS